MNITITIIMGAFLLAMTILDIKKKSMPSILPTIAILIQLAIIGVIAPTNLFFGVIGFTLAWLLYEFDFIRGVADMKAIIIISLLLTSMNQFFVMMVLIAGLGLIYKIICIKILKKKVGGEVPFIPALFCVYLTLIGLIYLT